MYVDKQLMWLFTFRCIQKTIMSMSGYDLGKVKGVPRWIKRLRRLSAPLFSLKFEISARALIRGFNVATIFFFINSMTMETLYWLIFACLWLYSTSNWLPNTETLSG